MDFPLGTATPAETCGECHLAIYREFSTGFGGDLKYPGPLYQAKAGSTPAIQSNRSASATAHALAAADSWPVHAHENDENPRSCNVCHFPQAFEIPDINTPEWVKPTPRPLGEEAAGLTCASCHLTPDGKIRGPYNVTDTTHATVFEPRMQTAAICAYCHTIGSRVVGKQTQTFLEWREDFHKPGLGRQECQDCHMPRTLRKTAEDADVPVRAVARHLWTGGHSAQRLGTALNLAIVQPYVTRMFFEFHVINIGAGHSVPTGSNRRGIYLQAELVDNHDQVVATNEWLFAPWYGSRPDDRKYIEDDKSRPDATAAMQADAQGPHEAPIRAGEERVLTWSPTAKGSSVRVRLIYDLNRYNDRTNTDDQTTIFHAALFLDAKAGGH